MDFKSVFTSPYVWIGGAALGLLALVSSGSKAATTNGPTGGFTPEEVRAWSDYNSAGYDAMARQAGIAGEIAKHRISADVTAQGHMLQFLAVADQNRTVLAMQRDESMAGIVQTSLATQASVIMDAQQNAARVKVATIDAATQRYIAGKQADVQKTGNIASAIGDLAGDVFKVMAMGA